MALPLSTSGSRWASNSWDTVLYYCYLPIAFFLPHPEFIRKILEAEGDKYNIAVEKDERGLLHMVFLPRHGSQGIIDPQEPDKLISSFMKDGFLSLAILKNPPKKALFIGMGAGIMPKYLHTHFPNCHIDIVEIDRVVPEIAQKYFGFKSDKNIVIHIADGRRFIEKCKKRYDLIVVDVYYQYGIPPQFLSVEFYRGLYRILNNGGIAIINIANIYKKKFILDEIKTAISLFSNGLILKTSDSHNYVLILSKEKLNINNIRNRAIILDKGKKFNFSLEKILSDIIDIQGELAYKKATLITDKNVAKEMKNCYLYHQNI